MRGHILKYNTFFYSPWQVGAHITWYPKIAQPNGGYVREKKIGIQYEMNTLILASSVSTPPPEPGLFAKAPCCRSPTADATRTLTSENMFAQKQHQHMLIDKNMFAPK